MRAPCNRKSFDTRLATFKGIAGYGWHYQNLCPKAGELTPHGSHLHGKVNRAFETNRYAYDAVDSLLQTIKDALSGRGITDAPVR